MDRDNLEKQWFALTRERLPEQAASRSWPVRFDHCFQRILLDNAIGGKWDEQIPAPAYRNAPDIILQRAVDLGQAALDGVEDLAELNRNSLAFRGKL